MWCHRPKPSAEALWPAENFNKSQGENIREKTSTSKAGLNNLQWELECKVTREACWPQESHLVRLQCGKLGLMARECNSMPQAGLHSGNSHFEVESHRNDPKDNDHAEMMDGSIWKHTWEGKKEKPTVRSKVDGKRIEAITDTRRAQTLIRADLAPDCWAPNVKSVKVLCMHGQIST